MSENGQPEPAQDEPQPTRKNTKLTMENAAKALAKDVEWLTLVEPGAEAKDVVKAVLKKLKSAVEDAVLELFCAACQAAGNVCQSEKGFLMFFKGGGVETIMGALADPPFKVKKDKPAEAAKENEGNAAPKDKDEPREWASDKQKEAHASKLAAKEKAEKATIAAEKAAAKALAKEAAKQASTALSYAIEEACDAAGSWCSELEYVDFQEMGNFIYLGSWMVNQSEDLALEVLDLIHRSVLIAVENAVALIQGGTFHVLHKILSSHRAPELVEEVLMILVRLCDLPEEATEDCVIPHLLQERDLVHTVVESLEQGPINIRLQLTGLRLLAVWARTPSHEVRALLRKAKPAKLLSGLEEKLGKAGYPHAASWVTAIAARPLKVALSKQDAKLAKKAGVVEE